MRDQAPGSATTAFQNRKRYVVRVPHVTRSRMRYVAAGVMASAVPVATGWARWSRIPRRPSRYHVMAPNGVGVTRVGSGR
jgi:hypothetical protein